MERRKKHAVDGDPLVPYMREMSNADLLKFFIELTSVFPRTRYRKSDIRLARNEIKQRMRKYCIVGMIKRATATKKVAV